MHIFHRRTIRNCVAIEGNGLHSGIYTRLELRPAETGTGLLFLRSDLNQLQIPALQASTTALDYATSVGRDDVTIGTVEHLLSAVMAAGLTDLEMLIDGPEIPIIDGSALPFVHLIEAAGVESLAEQIAPLRISRPIELSDGDKRIAIYPADELTIRYQIDFDHAAIGRQSMSFTMNRDSFPGEIAGARTFGFLRDVERLRAAGLARGGTVENCIVLSDGGIENGPLRFPDEFIRHKILDLIGDLALIGRPIIGEIVAERAGHALHSRLVEAILNSPDSWHVEDAVGAPHLLPAEQGVAAWS
jgi:UDP-3-O-[3-hydroxymyristoyl] N-acetylglucosamine deacetylase